MAVISAHRHPLTAESSRAAQRATDRDDEDDLLAIRITAPGDSTELERDYADDLEDLVALPLAQHLGSKRSRLPKLHLQPSSSATGLPKSPSLYASPRLPLGSSVSVSTNQQGWETLQDGTAQPVSSEPLSVEEPAADAAVVLPRPSRASEEAQRRLVSERSTRIPEKRQTATAEQRSVSQPPAARVRPAAARDDLSQIPSPRIASSSSSRPRLATATDLPSRLPTPRRRVPSQGVPGSVSPRTGTGEESTKHAVTTTAELELEDIVSAQTTTTAIRAIRAMSRTRQTPTSFSGRTGPLSGEVPAAAATAAGAARRLPARPATARVSTSRRTVSTSRMRTKSAPWPTGGGGESKSDEPLPHWSDDSGPRIYRSSEGELTFAVADSGHSPSSSPAAASAATGSLLPLPHHRPQDRVLPAVAKRIEAKRLKQLQVDDPGLGNAWLVSEWGVTGDPRRVVSVPIKALKADDPAENSQQQRDSSTTTTPTTTNAAAALPELSSRVDCSDSRSTEGAVMTQPDPPECPGGDFVAAAAECSTSTASFPPRHPSSAEFDARPHAALAEHGKPHYDDAEQIVRTARAAGDQQETDRLPTGIGRRPSPTAAAAIESSDTRHSSMMNTSQDDEGRISDPKSPGCCASCVIS